ncbi:glycosyltransferase family 71 protein [Venturia nashicola]|nr:glycosyltransferase family 71 protein [Venturia nashicola]
MRFTVPRLVLTSLILAIATYLYLSYPTHFTWPTIPGNDEKEPQSLTTKPPPPPQASQTPPKEARPIPPHNTTASPVLLDFWRTWASHFVAAKPRIGPVEVTWTAANVPAKQFVPYATRGKPVNHIDISDHDVNSLKGSHAQIRGSLEDFHVEEEVKKLYSGTGIVTVAGGEFFGPSIVGIRMLRQTGSALPVEVFLADWSEYESKICEEVYPALNARCIVITDYVLPDLQEQRVPDLPSITHFQLKALALLLSSFEQILYLDSDSIPLVDPQSELFSRPPYTHTGFIGWPDFWLGTESPIFYTIAGMGGDFPTNLPRTSSETGQILIDKRRHLRTLLLATYYNVWGPDYYYPLLSQGGMGQGDKNTFETAAIVLGVPYYRVITPAKSLSRVDGGQFRGSGLVQFDPTDDYRKYGKKATPSSSPISASASVPTTTYEMAEATKAAVHAPLLSTSDEKRRKRRKRQVAEVLGHDDPSIRPVFIHANTPKMNAGHLVDEGDLNDKNTGEALRLWGSLEDQEKSFGIDAEKKVWAEMVTSGCELENVIYDWEDREDICGRLKKHWAEVFAGGRT